MSKRKPGLNAMARRNARHAGIKVWVMRDDTLVFIHTLKQQAYNVLFSNSPCVCARWFKRMTGSLPKPGECKRYTLWGKETK